MLVSQEIITNICRYLYQQGMCTGKWERLNIAEGERADGTTGCTGSMELRHRIDRKITITILFNFFKDVNKDMFSKETNDRGHYSPYFFLTKTEFSLSNACSE